MLSSRLLLPEVRSAFAVIVGILIFVIEDRLLAGGAGVSFAIFASLLIAIVAVSVRVARHAESLAHRIDDPYGTMILTLSAVLIEVVILAMLMS